MDTNRGYAYDEKEASPYDRGTLAAIFDTPADARLTLQDLHDAGFHGTWMGVTSSDRSTSAGGADDTATGYAAASPGGSGAAGTGGERRVETVEGGGFGAALSRFFGETSHHSLYDSLTKEGVPGSDALALEHRLHDGGAVITVKVADRYDEALSILQRGRGDVSGSSEMTGGATGVRDAGLAAGAAATADMRTKSMDYDRDDDKRKLTLSEERLAVDKQRVSAGEATIEKRVVTERASVDVPVMREELFIQRRPVAEGDRTVSAGTIGTDETIRIPLMREQVVVDKRAFVREEVSIGKRTVSETQRVEDTVRREELDVDDSTSTGRSATGDVRDASLDPTTRRDRP